MQWLGMDKNSNLSRAAMTKQNNVIEQGHQDDWRQPLASASADGQTRPEIRKTEEPIL